jgi:hypothetical protein
MDYLADILKTITDHSFDILKTLGSTAVVVAALAFFARSTVKHLFDADLEKHKAQLKLDADAQLITQKRVADAQLLVQKNEFDHQMEVFKNDLATNKAQKDRIREEIVRWANPILGSVEGS